MRDSLEYLTNHAMLINEFQGQMLGIKIASLFAAK